jgi:hypothetical protein
MDKKQPHVKMVGMSTVWLSLWRTASFLTSMWTTVTIRVFEDWDLQSLDASATTCLEVLAKTNCVVE